MKYTFTNYSDNMIKAELIKKYKTATNKLLLLDYDGTLVNYESEPSKAKLSGYLLDILLTLVKQPQTKIIIISGRSYQDIDKFLGYLPIDIIAEHGAMFKEKGVWKKQLADIDLWKTNIRPVLEQITLTCPNSFIEEKLFSLVWHYRNAESELGYAHAKELINNLESIIHTYNLRIIDGNKVVEIIHKEIGKGIAVQKLLVEHKNFDYILSIGDDKTDEDMFLALTNNNAAFTIKVGAGETLAKYKLDNVHEVHMLLEQLSLLA